MFLCRGHQIHICLHPNFWIHVSKWLSKNLLVAILFSLVWIIYQISTFLSILIKTMQKSLNFIVIILNPIRSYIGSVNPVSDHQVKKTTFFFIKGKEEYNSWINKQYKLKPNKLERVAPKVKIYFAFL